MQTPRRRVLRIGDVTEYVGLSAPSIHRFVAAGKFPPPIRLGLRSVGWKITDLEAWIESREIKNGLTG